MGGANDEPPTQTEAKDEHEREQHKNYDDLYGEPLEMCIIGDREEIGKFCIAGVRVGSSGPTSREDIDQIVREASKVGAEKSLICLSNGNMTPRCPLHGQLPPKASPASYYSLLGFIYILMLKLSSCHMYSTAIIAVNGPLLRTGQAFAVSGEGANLREALSTSGSFKDQLWSSCLQQLLGSPTDRAFAISPCPSLSLSSLSLSHAAICAFLV